MKRTPLRNLHRRVVSRTRMRTIQGSKLAANVCGVGGVGGLGGIGRSYISTHTHTNTSALECPPVTQCAAPLCTQQVHAPIGTHARTRRLYTTLYYLIASASVARRRRSSSSSTARGQNGINRLTGGTAVALACARESVRKLCVHNTLCVCIQTARATTR